MPDMEKRAALLKSATTYTSETGLPLFAMTVFADWLERNNETGLAYAYRWAGKRGLFPKQSPKGRRWSWKRIPKRGAKPRFKTHWHLPHELYDAMNPIGSPGYWYRNPADAFSDLARALYKLRTVTHIPH
jgi:hypothetical protein